MKYLRLFETLNEYNDAKKDVYYPTISYIKETDKIECHKPMQYYIIKCKYNVTSTTDTTQLLYSGFNINNVYKMWVDSEEITPTQSYTFSTTGEHNVDVLMNDVTSIGDDAFNGCKGLTEITCLATTPPTIYYHTFYKVTNTIPVYVPAVSVEAYQTASYWSKFTDIRAIS